MCQSISGALACAPSRPISMPSSIRSCVSRSPARWPVRPPRRPHTSSHTTGVSRSPARWPVRRHTTDRLHITNEACQSISGALACAPDSPKQLGDALYRVSRSPARWPVRRTYSLRSSPKRVRSVSRSPARWPVRRIGCAGKDGGGRECQSISGALACAPDSLNRPLQMVPGVSRSPARWPVRLPDSVQQIVNS